MTEGCAVEQSPLPHSKQEGGGCGKRGLVGGVRKGGEKKKRGVGWGLDGGLGVAKERIHWEAVLFSRSYWLQAPSPCSDVAPFKEGLQS